MLTLLTNVRSTKVSWQAGHHPLDGHHPIITFSTIRKFGSHKFLPGRNLDPFDLSRQARVSVLNATIRSQASQQQIGGCRGNFLLLFFDILQHIEYFKLILSDEVEHYRPSPLIILDKSPSQFFWERIPFLLLLYSMLMICQGEDIIFSVSS